MFFATTAQPQMRRQAYANTGRTLGNQVVRLHAGLDWVHPEPGYARH